MRVQGGPQGNVFGVWCLARKGDLELSDPGLDAIARQLWRVVLIQG
jgi:hypothetical protein